MKTKKIVNISMVFVLCLSGLIALAPASLAAPEENASKLEIESISWDKTNQGFVVALSLKFGLATAGEHAGFSVATTLNFDADGNQVTLSDESNIVKVDGAIKDSDNMIIIDPTFIPWDRNEGTFEGPLEVTAEIRLLNPENIFVITVSKTTATVVVFDIQPARGDLQGTVTNSETSDPLDLVDVSVSRGGVLVASGQTNVTGEYSFNLRAGLYSVSFEKVGFSSENVAGVFVSPSSIAIVDAELDPFNIPPPPTDNP
jgi:hypothetical protein